MLVVTSGTGEGVAVAVAEGSELFTEELNNNNNNNIEIIERDWWCIRGEGG